MIWQSARAAPSCSGSTISTVPAPAPNGADNQPSVGLINQYVKDLSVENPNAPPPVRQISPADAAERAKAGTLTLVDVRPAEERAQSQLSLRFLTLDDGIGAVRELPADSPIAFLCHHGGRSQQAAEHFRELGHREVYNIEGGIDAWADIDESIPKY